MKDLGVNSDECLGFEESVIGLIALRTAEIFAIDVKNFYD